MAGGEKGGSSSRKRSRVATAANDTLPSETKSRKTAASSSRPSSAGCGIYHVPFTDPSVVVAAVDIMNFRKYYDEKAVAVGNGKRKIANPEFSIASSMFEFKNEGKANMITGLNGKGKTTIIEAIKYCLYGGTNCTPKTPHGSTSTSNVNTRVMFTMKYGNLKMTICRATINIFDPSARSGLFHCPPEYSNEIVGAKKFVIVTEPFSTVDSNPDCQKWLYDSDAQTYIEREFGPVATWMYSCYGRQNLADAFMTADSTKQWECIRILAGFGEEDWDIVTAKANAKEVHREESDNVVRIEGTIAGIESSISASEQSMKMMMEGGRGANDGSDAHSAFLTAVLPTLDADTTDSVSDGYADRLQVFETIVSKMNSAVDKAVKIHDTLLSWHRELEMTEQKLLMTDTQCKRFDTSKFEGLVSTDMSQSSLDANGDESITNSIQRKRDEYQNKISDIQKTKMSIEQEIDAWSAVLGWCELIDSSIPCDTGNTAGERFENNNFRETFFKQNPEEVIATMRQCGSYIEFLNSVAVAVEALETTATQVLDHGTEAGLIPAQRSALSGMIGKIRTNPENDPNFIERCSVIQRHVRLCANSLFNYVSAMMNIPATLGLTLQDVFKMKETCIPSKGSKLFEDVGMEISMRSTQKEIEDAASGLSQVMEGMIQSHRESLYRLSMAGERFRCPTCLSELEFKNGSLERCHNDMVTSNVCNGNGLTEDETDADAIQKQIQMLERDRSDIQMYAKYILWSKQMKNVGGENCGGMFSVDRYADIIAWADDFECLRKLHRKSVELQGAVARVGDMFGSMAKNSNTSTTSSHVMDQVPTILRSAAEAKRFTQKCEIFIQTHQRTTKWARMYAILSTTPNMGPKTAVKGLEELTAKQEANSQMYQDIQSDIRELHRIDKDFKEWKSLQNQHGILLNEKGQITAKIKAVESEAARFMANETVVAELVSMKLLPLGDTSFVAEDMRAIYVFLKECVQKASQQKMLNEMKFSIQAQQTQLANLKKDLAKHRKNKFIVENLKTIIERAPETRFVKVLNKINHVLARYVPELFHPILNNITIRIDPYKERKNGTTTTKPTLMITRDGAPWDAELSGGTKNRVTAALVLAMTSLNRFPFLFLDEVFSFVDIVNIDQVVEICANACTDMKKTLVMVDHAASTGEYNSIAL